MVAHLPHTPRPRHLEITEHVSPADGTVIAGEAGGPGSELDARSPTRPAGCRRRPRRVRPLAPGRRPGAPQARRPPPSLRGQCSAGPPNERGRRRGGHGSGYWASSRARPAREIEASMGRTGGSAPGANGRLRSRRPPGCIVDCTTGSRWGVRGCCHREPDGVRGVAQHVVAQECGACDLLDSVPALSGVEGKAADATRDRGGCPRDAAPTARSRCDEAGDQVALVSGEDRRCRRESSR